MTGRSSKLTPEVHDAIVTSIQSGNYFSTAAQAAGIHEDTAWRWLREANKDDVPDNDPRVAFAAAVARAEAEAEARAVRILGESMGEDWRAAVEYLKRRHRKGWSDRQEITGPDGEGLKVEHEHRGVPLSDVLELAKKLGLDVPASPPDPE